MGRRGLGKGTNAKANEKVEELQQNGSEDSMDVMVDPDMVTQADSFEQRGAGSPGNDHEAATREETVARVSGDLQEKCNTKSGRNTDTNRFASKPKADTVDINDGAALKSPEHSEIGAGSHRDMGNAPQRTTESTMKLTPRVEKPTSKTQAEHCDNKAKSNRKQMVRENGLDFDIDEPWQRSLLRELKKTREDRNYKPKSPAELLLLGHTESRDYAVEMGRDDLTLATESSATLPARSQAIHRPWLYPDDPPLFADEDNDNFSTTSSKQPEGSHVDDDDLESPRSVREEREVGLKLHLDQPSRGNGRKVKAKSLPSQARGGSGGAWLEMEPSDIDQHDDDVTVSTVAVTSNNKDACFCMGYNVLDMVLPPEQGSPTHGRRKMRFPRHQQKTKRHTTLGRVEESAFEHIVSADRSSSSRYRNQIESKLSTRTDPDGAYNNNHY